jgi:hypothetical protein
MAQWKVKEGTQVKYDGKMHAAGDTFSATEEQVASRGLSAYVEPVTKAQQSGANKAVQEPEGNKSSAPSRNK